MQCIHLRPALAAAHGLQPLSHSSANWLEPCVGRGSLLAAISEHGVSARHVVGVDPLPSFRADRFFGDSPAGNRVLKWANGTPVLVDRIVANRPFIAAGKLPTPIQEAAIRTRKLLMGSTWKGRQLLVRVPMRPPVAKEGRLHRLYLASSFRVRKLCQAVAICPSGPICMCGGSSLPVHDF